jgi:hypothetical protein
MAPRLPGPPCLRVAATASPAAAANRMNTASRSSGTWPMPMSIQVAGTNHDTTHSASPPPASISGNRSFFTVASMPWVAIGSATAAIATRTATNMNVGSEMEKLPPVSRMRTMSG